jgi:hypothetical protein
MKKSLVNAIQAIGERRQNNIDSITSFVNGLIALLIQKKVRSFNLSSMSSKKSLTGIFSFVMPATQRVKGRVLVQISFNPDWYERQLSASSESGPDFFDHNNLKSKLAKIPSGNIQRIARVMSKKNFAIECN